MMNINLVLVIVLSAMVAVLWCHKCDEYNRLGFKQAADTETFIDGNFNNRTMNSDAIKGPGMGAYDSRYISPSGWSVYNPVYKEGSTVWSRSITDMKKESFTGGCGCGF